jgi:hypothetical protein
MVMEKEDSTGEVFGADVHASSLWRRGYVATAKETFYVRLYNHHSSRSSVIGRFV